MSDVQDQIAQMIDGWFPGMSTREGRDIMAATLMQRFEVTPRPVVTAEQMGRIMRSACLYSVVTDGGQYALDELAKRGLTIVRRAEVIQ